jgi:hypothetical protein
MDVSKMTDRAAWDGEDFMEIHLTKGEIDALLAAGRAAGCTDLKSVIYGVLDDAIGIGCRVLRAVADADEDKRVAQEESALAELDGLIVDITGDEWLHHREDEEILTISTVSAFEKIREGRADLLIRAVSLSKSIRRTNPILEVFETALRMTGNLATAERL